MAEGKILCFRAARGHPAQRAKPAPRKPLLELTAVCFELRGRCAGEGPGAPPALDVGPSAAAWRALLERYRIALDFRGFAFGEEDTIEEPTDEFSARYFSPLGGVSVRKVWFGKFVFQEDFPSD